jgi:AraC family transcriptional regulator
MTKPLPAPLPARPEYIRAQLRTPRVRCAETFYPAGLSVPPHLHERASLTLVLGGSFVESKGRARARCVGGTAILRLGGEPHANQIGVAGALDLEVEMGEQMAAWCEVDQARRSVVTHPSVTIAGQRLRAELQVKDRAQPLVVEALALELVGRALRDVWRESSRHPPPWLRRVREKLSEQFREDLSIAELAREADVHPMSLMRAFRRHFRTSPGTFVRARRIAWAAERLELSDAPLAEVAMEAGFYDQSHFGRVFRAQMGVSPGEYRKAFGLNAPAAGPLPPLRRPTPSGAVRPRR